MATDRRECGAALEQAIWDRAREGGSSNEILNRRAQEKRTRSRRVDNTTLRTQGSPSLPSAFSQCCLMR